MIPVTPQKEPDDFETKVRMPGQKFLDNHPTPSKDDWNKRGKKIWQKASKQLRDKYNKTCAYSAEWMPFDEKSIDHFISRDEDKTQAFEWCNFRLSLAIVNQYKSSQKILDPFKIQPNWFVISFEFNLVRPNKNLESPLQIQIDDTITKLKLNEIPLKERRLRWIKAYCKGSTGIEGLRTKAPFIVYELERQGYEEKIKEIYERYISIKRKIIS